MIKAVFFDLDDTLISEIDFTKSGLLALSSYLAFRYNCSKMKVYDELWRLYQASPKNVFNRWLDFHKINYQKTDIDFMVNLFRKHQPTVSFFLDVRPTIKFLKSQKIKVGIITDGFQESQRQKINALKASEVFDYIYITDEYGKEYWKPNIKIFELIKIELNCNYDEIIYVGDNPKKDFHFGKSLGIKCFRIIRPNAIYKNEKYLDDVKEYQTLNRLDELLQFV